MELYLDFIGQQWILASTLAGLLVLLALHESKKGAKGLSPQQLSNQVNRHDGVVVDIREKAEFKTGHIVDSINIPHAQFAKHLSELEKHKDKPIILVCKHGQHAGAISKQLKTAGFESVYKLSGGLAEWQVSQLPLVKK